MFNVGEFVIYKPFQDISFPAKIISIANAAYTIMVYNYEKKENILYSSELKVKEKLLSKADEYIPGFQRSA